MTEFAGWEMPVSYRGILAEHDAVRTRAGVFDVSHMGVVELSGPTAGETCQRLTTNDVGRLVDGAAQYTLMCSERGGVLDDVILYRLTRERFVVCVNAGNAETDVEWIRRHALASTDVIDRRGETALVALQGPRAAAVLDPLTEAPVSRLARFGCVETRVADVSTMCARTGYTGEDGFELFVPATGVVAVWDRLLATGGVEPVGLGARDTLRLEAGLLLHGADMDASTTPYEAGLDVFVKLQMDFIGREALRAQAGGGVRSRLVRFLLEDVGVPRHGYVVERDGVVVGCVTSGGVSPLLGRGIGLATVERPHDAPETRLGVKIRGRCVPAVVMRESFLRRARAARREAAPPARGSEGPTDRRAHAPKEGR